MNKIILIGNLTHDPETRTTTTGQNVCTFSVAVNRRKRQDGSQPEADFFRVSAWNQLGENCARYLSKGKKVCVTGMVTAHAFMGNDGQARASLEVMANEVEFLSSAGQDQAAAQQASQPQAAQAYQQPTAQQQTQQGYRTVEVPTGQTVPPVDPQSGMQQVEMAEDDLPF